MAAFMARRCALSISKLSSPSSVIGCLFSDPAGSRVVPFRRLLSGINTGHSQKFHLGTAKGLTGALSATVAGTVTFVWVQQKFCLSVAADDGKQRVDRPAYTPARSIKSNTDDTGLKLTLYQYQTCPFCCKLRAYLDYRGFSYDVIEVNSVWRTQTKWSKYKKVPILVVEGMGPDGFLQLNDSSVIASILESFLVNRSESPVTLQSYYPTLETTTKRGKVEYDFPNRYFIMYGENKAHGTADSRKEERKWRHWTDSVLVHALSPNIYRTPSEAIESFRYFSEAGDWEKQFSFFQRKCVIYVGSAAMYLVGKSLIKKYNLKPDVRESLYDACNEWTKAIGKKRQFMGGEQPNLSDLSVYGVLSSIEGCLAFKDMLAHTKIGDWYYRMKDVVDSHQGSRAMTSFVHH